MLRVTGTALFRLGPPAGPLQAVTLVLSAEVRRAGQARSTEGDLAQGASAETCGQHGAGPGQGQRGRNGA